MSEYIHVANWDKFQHYTARRPSWIKNYVDLLSNDDYLELTAHQRSVLHGVWLMYASHHRQVRLSTSSLSRQLGLRVMRRDIESLAHAGFLTISASKSCETASLEVKKRKRETNPNGLVRNELWDALSDELGAPQTKGERSRRGSVVKELLEAGCTAEGVHERCDRWHRGWPDMTLTDTALAKHWTTLAKLEPPSPSSRKRNGGVSADAMLRALSQEQGSAQ